MTIGRADLLEGYHVWKCPFVRIHAESAATGMRVCMDNVGENIPSATQAYDMTEHTTRVPLWKETLTLPVDISIVSKCAENDNIAIIFEIYENENTAGAWMSNEYLVAWSFLKLGSCNGHSYVNILIPLQLFAPIKPQRGSASGDLLELSPKTKKSGLSMLGHSILNSERVALAGALHVRIHAAKDLRPQGKHDYYYSRFIFMCS